MAQGPTSGGGKKEEELNGEAEGVKWKLDSEGERWTDINTLLSRPSEKFCPPPFNPDEENYLDRIQNQRRVLVVGAGGLGCEILKNLALSGFKDIEVLDLDTIELSNLNRQFLFRKNDIDSAKAKCAAEFVVKRVPGCNIKWHRKKLEDFGSEFYRKFDCVIAGLDNVEARRWLNAMLYDLVEFDEESQIKPETIIPFIDGGTEGFLGQVRLFIPRLSACFECSVGTMTPPKAFQSCTIASIPRRPEHCIAYAHKVLWNKLKWLKSAEQYEMETDKNKPDPCGVPLDKDDVDHMSWIFNRATERAKEFNIEGVNYNLTMQVVKNIIPAIASTNALVSAACVNECLKALTWCSYGLINYFMYMGQDGIYTRTFDYKQNPQCPVCGTVPLLYKLDGDKTTFETLHTKILNDETLKLKDPSVSVGGKTIFMAGKNLRAMYEENMKKPINTLFESGSVLQVTDPKCLGRGAAKIKVEFEKDALYIPPKDE